MYATSTLFLMDRERSRMQNMHYHQANLLNSSVFLLSNRDQSSNLDIYSNESISVPLLRLHQTKTLTEHSKD